MVCSGSKMPKICCCFLYLVSGSSPTFKAHYRYKIKIKFILFMFIYKCLWAASNLIQDTFNLKKNFVDFSPIFSQKFDGCFHGN